MDKTKFYMVTDGRLVLHLEPDETGGYVVTSPFYPELVTEADTIEEAFVMAEDALQGLAEAERKHPRVSRNGQQPKRSSQKKRRNSSATA
jgi:predicted RNase H-like HicB family nuclease